MQLRQHAQIVFPGSGTMRNKAVLRQTGKYLTPWVQLTEKTLPLRGAAQGNNAAQTGQQRPPRSEWPANAVHPHGKIEKKTFFLHRRQAKA